MDNTSTESPKPKRKRRTPEEIEADRAAKEKAKAEKQAERERKAAEREAEKERKAEEKRLKKGPWTEEELKAMAKDFLKTLPKAKRIYDRKDRSQECYVLNGEWSAYGTAEVVGSGGDVYDTSLTKCSCPDFRFHRAECCKHQLCLADYILGKRTEEQRLLYEEQRLRYEEERAKREAERNRIEREEARRREEEEAILLEELRRKAELERKENERKETVATVKGVLAFLFWLIVIGAAFIAGIAVLLRSCAR